MGGQMNRRRRMRSQEFEVFTHDEQMKHLVAAQGIKLTGYLALRELQRRERQQAYDK
jgi:hypothetical protein